jgi:hypothetical protein
MTTSTRARGAARSAGKSPGLQVLARLGFAASALVHLLLGYLAVRVALHHGGESDQSGAIEAVGRLPGGGILLWVMTVGLFALGLWLILQAVLGIGPGDVKRWLRALTSAAKAAAYVALAVTALAFARGSSSHASASTKRASANVLDLPGGQVLLAAIGLVALAVGVYLVVKGVQRKFRQDLDMPSGAAGRAVTVLGVVGYVAKGIAVGVVGILFDVAAFTLDPGRASGLDGALKALSALPFGAALLIAVGVGLTAFGIYTFARARYARL